MPKKITINTAEDVDLNYKIAGPGSRIAAGLIDLSIIWAIIFLLMIFLVATGGVSLSLSDVVEGRIPAQMSQWALILLLGSIFFLNIAYFIFFENLRNGQTIGKKVLGLRVSNDNGQILTLSASIIRNIARMVDFIPGPYFIGLISVLISSRGQRLGDMIAGTIVIKFEHVSMPQPAFPGLTFSDLENVKYTFQHDELSQIGTKGFQILTAYYQRREHLQSDEIRNLEAKLTRNFEAALGKDKNRVDTPSLYLKELYLSLRDHLQT